MKGYGEVMKSTGMTRPVDELGRVVIPKELRKSLNIVEKVDTLEIFVDGPNIILRKYEPLCGACKQSDDLNKRLLDKGVKLCNKCIKEAGGM
jgi:transcriptional pleiotropic regulator of transition state genes